MEQKLRESAESLSLGSSAAELANLVRCADCNYQRKAIEHILEPTRHADLLETRDRKCKESQRYDGASYVKATGSECSGAEKYGCEGREKKLCPQTSLCGTQPSGEENPA
jgi:hypothetical protein